MQQLEAADRDSERLILQAYHHGRSFGLSPRAAYAAALRKLLELRPEIGGSEALGTVKDALSRVPEVGLVDSGPTKEGTPEAA